MCDKEIQANQGDIKVEPDFIAFLGNHRTCL